MTHAKKAKTGVNSRSEKRSSPLTEVSKKQGNWLEGRVARLEARIEQMQEEIDRALGGIPPKMLGALDSIGKKHPGPQKKIDDTELLLNRDNIVQWLEEHWPNIAKPLLAAKTPGEVLTALVPIAAAPDIRPPWQSAVMDHPGATLDFLRSWRFRRKPPKKTVLDALAPYQSEKRMQAANRLPTRQIANAMAGIPKLKWRTSLDKCLKSPSSQRIGHKAAKHYRELFGIPQED